MSVAAIEVGTPGRPIACLYEAVAVEDGDEVFLESESQSEESSSIGKNSDDDGDEVGGGRCSESGEEGEGENEAQSCYKGGLELMEELEQVLPMRRGISKFYNGKSKSFTSLADASASSSVREIVKPENAYSRRCRNLMAFNHVWDKNRPFPLRGNSSGGISKRPLGSSKSTLALAVAMTHCDSYSSASEDSGGSSNVSRSPPTVHLPPLPPRSRGSSHQLSSPRRNLSTWKSYSVADLHRHGIPTDLVYHVSVAEKTGHEGPS
ncbi:hypothetical protein MLD38_014213 [Melastoma candidum]|uniref:Uncharacterized protein n=1 Tax=Melastoma candidum TaxID=119954 RepID=A0ACB9RBN7_9MYRT|nr:hypothetical protein MLD38_014213 [Melastoma candidum]